MLKISSIRKADDILLDKLINANNFSTNVQKALEI